MKTLKGLLEIRNSKPIIAMLHMGGENSIKQAMEELTIYEKEGIDAVLFENYFCKSTQTIFEAMTEARKRTKISIGVNLLHSFEGSFKLANQCGADFIQIDSIHPIDLGINGLGRLMELRKTYPSIFVLGGMGFKYQTQPINLREELKDAVHRCNAIVTTGEGTGIETPIDKITKYRRELNSRFPLIIGAGVTASNVYEQLLCADGAIVGTFLKHDGKTENSVDKFRVMDLMGEVIELRRNYPL